MPNEEAEDRKRLLWVLFLAMIPVVWTIIASSQFYKAGIIYIVMFGVTYIFYTRKAE